MCFAGKSKLFLFQRPRAFPDRPLLHDAHPCVHAFGPSCRCHILVVTCGSGAVWRQVLSRHGLNHIPVIAATDESVVLGSSRTMKDDGREDRSSEGGGDGYVVDGKVCEHRLCEAWRDPECRHTLIPVQSIIIVGPTIMLHR